jgi:putative transposase
LQGKIKRCTIIKTPIGKLFVSILCEVIYKPLPKTNKAIAIDLGIKYFAVTSDADITKNYRHLKRYERDLAKAQKHLSRKKKVQRAEINSGVK